MLKAMRMALLAVAVVFSGIAAPHTNDIPQEIVDWSRANVWHVNPDMGQYGSGFWVDSETFITACHVVSATYLSFERGPDEPDGSLGDLIKTEEFEVAPEALVSNWNSQKDISLKVVSCNTETDVAVLKRQWFVSDSTAHIETTHIVRGTTPQGAAVYGPGYGLSELLYIGTGHWQNKATYDRDGFYTDLITIPTISGDSGSPVLTFIDGEVVIVGIRQMIRFEQGIPIPHLALAADGKTIAEAIDTWQQSNEH